MNSHQVSVAGEAFAACLFAQAACDVLIQYGACIHPHVVGIAPASEDRDFKIVSFHDTSSLGHDATRLVLHRRIVDLEEDGLPLFAAAMIRIIAVLKIHRARRIS